MRRATVPSVNDGSDKPVPRLGRKPLAVMPAQRVKRQARDELATA
jgi:hypothetical protein